MAKMRALLVAARIDPDADPDGEVEADADTDVGPPLSVSDLTPENVVNSKKRMPSGIYYCKRCANKEV